MSPLDFFYPAALEHIGEGVFFLDLQQRILFLNPAAGQMCGIDPGDALGSGAADLLQLLDPDSGPATPLAELLVAAESGPVCGRFFLQHQDGHRLLIELRLLPVHVPAGPLCGVQGIMTDASAQIDISQVNRCLHKLIRIDSLTHLPNQRALGDAMKTEYLRFARYQIPFALIATTLDNIDSVASNQNDPARRNAILQWFARQLTGALRKSDLAGRVRGDLFCILLPHTDAAAAARAARKVMERLLRFPCPQAPTLTASFGCVAISRQDTLDRLQERARRALYRASSSGGNQVTVL